ncbi:hypothetical protein HA466_0253190 [Hirschfeldia incana]|nr:hypothetical protein HA466_0253190 [Hirschfeldia incana]
MDPRRASTLSRSAMQTKPMRKTEERKKKPSGRFIGKQQRGGRESPRERRRRPPRRETNPNNDSDSSVNSANNSNRPAKFVSVPATDKEKSSSDINNNAQVSNKRVTVKRNMASPRSQSPARAASPRALSPERVNTSSNAQPYPFKLRRKMEHSPYMRIPFGEIDPNSLAYPQPHHGNTNSNKKMMNGDNESANLEVQMNAKMGTHTQAPIRRSASPSRVIKEQQEALEECKMTVCFVLIVVRRRCAIKGQRKWLSIFYLVYG